MSLNNFDKADLQKYAYMKKLRMDKMCYEKFSDDFEARFENPYLRKYI